MEAAKIKVHSRLKPAKDIHVAFSNLISCTNPNDFSELKQKLILAIDSAEVEYNILQDEFNTMEILVDEWNKEINQCEQQQLFLQEENDSLLHEKDEIEQEKEKVDKLNEMKSIIKTEKVSSKIDSINKIKKENELKRKEIKEVKRTNKIRKYGKDLLEEGYQIFLLYKKSPINLEEEDNIDDGKPKEEDEDEENEDQENEDREELDDDQEKLDEDDDN